MKENIPQYSWENTEDVFEAMLHLSHIPGPVNKISSSHFVEQTWKWGWHTFFWCKDIFVIPNSSSVWPGLRSFCGKQRHITGLDYSFLYLDIHSQLKKLDKIVGYREENYEENQKLSFHWGLWNKYILSIIFCSLFTLWICLSVVYLSTVMATTVYTEPEETI